MALFRFNDMTIQKYYYRKFYPFKLEIITSGETSLTIFNYSSVTYGGGLVSIPSLSYDYELDWGDGSEKTRITTHNHTGLSHTYTSSTGGTYTLSIHGLCESLRITSNSLTGILDWGYSGLKLLSFQNSSNFETFPIIDRYKGLSDILLFDSTFMGTKISSIPQKIFWHSRKVRHLAFSNTFNNCTNLTEIPTDLFKYNVNAGIGAFTQTFGSTKISSIPTNLFRYNINVSDYGTYFAFGNTFYNCTFLQTLPSDLFRYNTKITKLQGTFYGSAVYELPTDLLRYNTELTDLGNAFSGMIYLQTIPTDLFRYNTKVTTFYLTFGYCSNLQNVPDYLFKYNLNATNFTQTFLHCNKLKINQWLFSDSGETNTRFYDKDMDFTECFFRNVWSGSQAGYGQLPYYNYGTKTPIVTRGYGGTGNNSSSITNYNSIPSGWK